MKISKNKKMRFFLMSQGSLDLKIRILVQKVCSVARVQTDTQTDTEVNTEDTLSGFQDFSPSTYHQELVQFQMFSYHMKDTRISQSMKNRRKRTILQENISYHIQH